LKANRALYLLKIRLDLLPPPEEDAEDYKDDDIRRTP
ncbi:hypothetical protein HKBW3S25_01689, partial [Candidatus Hakubella thermalkaliphila]